MFHSLEFHDNVAWKLLYVIWELQNFGQRAFIHQPHKPCWDRFVPKFYITWGSIQGFQNSWFITAGDGCTKKFRLLFGTGPKFSKKFRFLSRSRWPSKLSILIGWRHWMISTPVLGVTTFGLLERARFKLMSVTLKSDGEDSDSSNPLLSNDTSDFSNSLSSHWSFSPDDLGKSMVSSAGNERSSNVTCTDSVFSRFQ